jgi:hypothetical protein
MTNEELIEKLEQLSKTIYIAVPEAVADDISSLVAAAASRLQDPGDKKCKSCEHTKQNHTYRYMGQLAGDDVPWCWSCKSECEFT